MARHFENMRHGMRITMLAVVAALLAACASTGNKPVGELERARQAIANAEEARAAEHAPLELSQARNKLDAANNAVDRELMEQAAQLAHEARVLAELASARAEMEDAARINREIVKTTEILKEEINRNRNREMGGLR